MNMFEDTTNKNLQTLTVMSIGCFNKSRIRQHVAREFPRIPTKFEYSKAIKDFVKICRRDKFLEHNVSSTTNYATR